MVLLSVVSGLQAKPTDFILLLRETLNRCWYRKGGEFTVYVSALSSQSDRLAVRLTEGRSMIYEEHVYSGKVRTGRQQKGRKQYDAVSDTSEGGQVFDPGT